MNGTGRPRILVDADACPASVRAIVAERARRHALVVRWYSTHDHDLGLPRATSPRDADRAEGFDKTEGADTTERADKTEAADATEGADATGGTGGNEGAGGEAANAGGWVLVGKGPDAVDHRIASDAAEGDVVVTQDYGLAALVLPKGARAVSPTGLVYSDGNIASLLAQRFLAAKARRGGGRVKGPRRRTKEDDARFAAALDGILEARAASEPRNGGRG